MKTIQDILSEMTTSDFSTIDIRAINQKMEFTNWQNISFLTLKNGYEFSISYDKQTTFTKTYKTINGAVKAMSQKLDSFKISDRIIAIS